jgi:hypothetical protein
MPWAYRFDPRCDAFCTEAFDLLTAEDIKTGVIEIPADPNFRPNVRILDDFTRVTDYIIPHPIESALHMQQESRRLRGRHAILLGPKMPSGPGVDHFLSVAGREASRFRVFYDRAAALAWINEGVAPAEWIHAAASERSD